MKQHSIVHINARTCRETIALQDGQEKVALIVETDLVQNPEVEGFDAEAFLSLKDAAQRYVAMQTDIDVIVFSTIGEH
jgi:hypothetical protein